MGILKHLLFWPVTGPAALARFSLEQVGKAAEGELTDEGRVQDELMECQLLLELGEIDEDEYVRREAEIMTRLREVREWRERLGMQPTWGPMTVRRDEGSPGDGPPEDGSPEDGSPEDSSPGDEGSREDGSPGDGPPGEGPSGAGPDRPPTPPGEGPAPPGSS